MSMLLLNLCEKMIMTYVVILKKKKQKKKILINIYTRVCAYVYRNFFFSSLKRRKWRIVCSASLKDHFSFRLFLTIDRQPDAQKHTHTHTHLVQSYTQLTWNDTCSEQNILPIRMLISLNWIGNFFFSCLSSCLIFSLTGLGGGGGDDELTHTPEIEIERFRSVTLEIK